MRQYMFDFTKEDNVHSFEDYIGQWLADNKYAIVEAGGDARSYFRRAIEEKERTSGFWIEGERVQFTSDMERAVDRVEAQWKGTGFNTTR